MTLREQFVTSLHKLWYFVAITNIKIPSYFYWNAKRSYGIIYSGFLHKYEFRFARFTCHEIVSKIKLHKPNPILQQVFAKDIVSIETEAKKTCLFL